MGASSLTQPDAEGVEIRYTVNDVARMVGCSAATLRRWEAEGLVVPDRSPSGYRFYGSAHLSTLQRIIHLRHVERLNTAGIRRVLALEDRSHFPTPRVAAASPPVRAPLRALRRRHRLTLKQVAEATDLSTSFLSAIERGQSGISAATLARLLSFYGTTPEEISRDGRVRRDIRLSRPGERRTFINRSTATITELLASGSDLQMEAQLFTIEPGGGNQEGYSHDGEEFIFVIEGELEITLGVRKRHVLRVGDCLYFHSRVKHSWRNASHLRSRVIWVNTPNPTDNQA
jgi:DNA-binding transcriptional MerR regulator